MAEREVCSSDDEEEHGFAKSVMERLSERSAMITSDMSSQQLHSTEKLKMQLKSAQEKLRVAKKEVNRLERLVCDAKERVEKLTDIVNQTLGQSSSS